MFNRSIIAGNLTRDVEVRYTQGGSAIASTAIASTRKFKSQTGEQKEEVLFVDLTFFGRTAEIANQYLRKGSKVLVEGRLKLDQWTDQQGQKRSKHSITVETLQMLDSKPDAAGQNGQNYGHTGQPQTAQHQTAQHQAAPQGQHNGQPAHSGQQQIAIGPNGEEIPF